MEEPTNSDKFYIRVERTQIDGKYGKAKFKVWTDSDGTLNEKLISFDADR